MSPTPIFLKAVKKPPRRLVKPADPAPPEAAPDAPPAADPPSLDSFAGLLALLADRTQNAGNFGPDNVKEGHHVAFSAGAFDGAGKVHAVGRDGVTVADNTGRHHQVHWREVTGHYAGEDGQGEPAADSSGAVNAKK